MKRTVTDLPATSNSLGLAIVLCSSTPLLLLDMNGVVRAASASFCAAFGLDPKTVSGSKLYALGAGEWDIRQLRSLLGASVAGRSVTEAYEVTLRRGDDVRELVLHSQPLNYAGADEVLLLVAVTDVTAARLLARQKDDLIREKQVLLQELQHRVANSLQIIASVLIQSARKVQSEEARAHLTDAHNRVMSIAMLQKQLAKASEADVALRPYFADLCNSIGASMIDDPTRIRITATVDDSVMSSDLSVSLGLIVTELVINSLKHAFADEAVGGIILVEFSSTGDGWSLSVGDNGMGRQPNYSPGLGTGIIQALSKQLGADVTTTDGANGTLVTIKRADPTVVTNDGLNDVVPKTPRTA